LLGLRYKPQELAAFGSPPEPVPGFITFASPGWSILRLRQAVSGRGGPLADQRWYDLIGFATDADTPGYRQVRREAVTGSFGWPFEQQQAMLPPEEEVPPARLVVMAAVLHFLATGERLFPTHYVRCGDQDPEGRVVVGCFGDSGLEIFYAAHGDFEDRCVGVASAKKV
jgi:hypothetical protein